MYDQLVKDLRDGAEFLECSTPGIKNSFAEMCHNAADAIEALQRCLDGVCSDNDVLYERIDELSRELDVANDANIALYGALPQWIPVEEELPERGKDVIVANKRGKQWDIDKAWLSLLGSGFDRCGKRSLYHVTHWMPLPEPPKEE